ncbi:helix-turn-helix domain-containing protein [Paucibacter sp. O1-1]|nr:helix-turn-helix domain-containing protein [Paucibacter sp. O1-1]MDA3829661.1 helix-turn-helix domain-containing protein [Paucibacter sp. O1-1]
MSERLFLRLDDDELHGPEAHMPPGTLHACPVAAPLRPYVSHILAYRETIPAGSEILERVLPDGALRLIVELGDAPTVQVLGASAAPVLLRLQGRLEGLSLTVRPGAAAALLGLPAGELTGQVLPLDSLWRGAGAELGERLGTSQGDTARLTVLQAFLQRRLPGPTITSRPAVMQALRLIGRSEGRRPLHEIAAAMGVGERRLQQLFQLEVGLSPRTWSRLARLQACLRRLRLQGATPGWVDLALDSGFYDQAHLAKEFRALCGLSPTEFLARAVSGSSKTGS